MILTDKEVQERLENPENLINKIKIIPPRERGNIEGLTNIPTEVKKLIASVIGESSETQKEIGSIFGISQATVSGISRGLVGERLDEELAEVVGDSKKRIQDKEIKAHELALDSLMASLGQIGPKIPDADLNIKDLTRVARDMSVISANLRKGNKEEGNTTNNTVVVLHAAERRKESVYEVIEA